MAGALAWGAAISASVCLVLVWRGWHWPSSILAVAGLFGGGATLAFLFVQLIWRHLAPPRLEAAMALAAILHAGTAIAVIAALYGLQYRAYYAQWHEPGFSLVWFIQFAVTMAGAFYQFAVIGLGLLLPLGLPLLAVLAIWQASMR
jgi:hypothetical protein